MSDIFHGTQQDLSYWIIQMARLQTAFVLMAGTSLGSVFTLHGGKPFISLVFRPTCLLIASVKRFQNTLVHCYLSFLIPGLCRECILSWPGWVQLMLEKLKALYKCASYYYDVKVKSLLSIIVSKSLLWPKTARTSWTEHQFTLFPSSCKVPVYQDCQQLFTWKCSLIWWNMIHCQLSSQSFIWSCVHGGLQAISSMVVLNWEQLCRHRPEGGTMGTVITLLVNSDPICHWGKRVASSDPLPRGVK